MKTKLLISCIIIFYWGSSIAQNKINDESTIKTKEYSIIADTNKLIHITIFSQKVETETISITISNIRGETEANFVYNKTDKTKANETFIFNGNTVATFSMEYFVEIIINGKKNNHEIEFPHQKQ